jgi:hypothetical protein
MLNEEEEDNEDYQRNLIVKLDHLLVHRKYAKNPHDKRSDMPYKE